MMRVEFPFLFCLTEVLATSIGLNGRGRIPHLSSVKLHHTHFRLQQARRNTQTHSHKVAHLGKLWSVN